jgi:hypothetical protein
MIAAAFTLFVATALMELAVFVPLGVFSTIMHPSSAGTSPFAASSMPFWFYPVCIVLGLAMQFIQIFFYTGFLKMANAAMRRQPVRVEDAFSGWNRTVPMYLYHLPVTIISYAIGFPFSAASSRMTATGVFPWGIYFAMFGVGVVVFLLYSFMLPGMALIADGTGPIEAYRRSFKGVLKEVWPLTLVAIIMTVFGVLAILTCGLGYFALIPMWAIIISLLARDGCGLPGEPEGSVFPFGGWGDASQAVAGAWPPAPDVWPPAPTPSGQLAGPPPVVPPPHDEAIAETALPDLEPLPPVTNPDEPKSPGA